MSRPWRVIIVDDHSLVRAGIRALLSDIGGVDVVAEASDGRQALDLIKSHRPDLVLMDISMSGMNGLETTTRVSKEFPDVRILILSMHTHKEYVMQALHAGASGYMIKDSGRDDLQCALETIREGKTYLSPLFSKFELDAIAADSGDPLPPFGVLTSRQREVLQLIAEGKNTKQIGIVLGVSAKTVETHRAQLMNRLEIHDTAGLVRYAIRMGLVPPA